MVYKYTMVFNIDKNKNWIITIKKAIYRNKSLFRGGN